MSHAKLSRGGRRRPWLLLLLAAVFLLPACSADEKEPEGTAPVRLTYAVLGEDAAIEARAMVLRFNSSHQDVKVDLLEYVDENGRSAKDRLITEMLTGKIPDIIDLGKSGSTKDNLPYQVLIQKGYLEDLWPYIENDPELGREGVLEAPLKAAEFDGGLYAVFGKVHIITLAGPERLIGDRKAWTLSELREAYAAMPEGSTILPYYFTKELLFELFFYRSIESYIDRGAGTCSFTCEKFKSALEFANSFPDTFDLEAKPSDRSSEENHAINLEAADRMLHGYQMLQQFALNTPMDLQLLDACFGLGGRAVPIGFPMEDGSVGSTFDPARTLGMSSVCENKEAAWLFLRELLLPEYKDVDALSRQSILRLWEGIPVNRSDYDLLLKASAGGKLTDTYHSFTITGFPKGTYHAASRSDIDRFNDLVNSIEIISFCDRTVYDIAYEVSTAYFAGHKTLDEAAQLIQDRVQLYLNERM